MIATSRFRSVGMLVGFVAWVWVWAFAPPLLGNPLAPNEPVPTLPDSLDPTEPGDAAPQDNAHAPEAAPASMVYMIPIHGPITDLTADFITRSVEQAKDAGVEIVVFDMNTPGGQVSSAISISTDIKSLDDVRTVAWVHPEAISAGALISVACDQIVVASRSKIGDCAPIMVTQQGLQSLGETEREKIESYILTEFRESAEENDYPVALCESMVTLGPAVYRIVHKDTGEQRYVFEDELPTYGLSMEDTTPLAEGVIVESDTAPEADGPTIITPWSVDKRVVKERTLLTMTDEEALDFGFATTTIDNDQELLIYLNASDAELVKLEQNWSEDLVAWLTSPIVRGLLTIIFLMALYSEMQAPGLGFAGAVALGAGALLLGAPLMTGLASNLELVVIAIGILLIVVEIFVLPGFGIAGVVGGTLLFGGLLLTFVPDEPGPGFIPTLPGTWDALQTGMFTMVVAGFATLIGIYFLTKFYGSIPLFNRLVLTAEQAAGGTGQAVSAGVGGTSSTELPVVVGDRGVTVGELHPIGRARFDQNVIEVTTSGGWIAANTPVRITEVRGNRVVVEEA